MVTLLARRSALVLATAAISIVPFAAEAAATPVVDTSFGGGSITPKAFPGSKWKQVARGAVLQPDGKVVAAMSLSTKFNRRTKRPVVRYNADGSIDRSYGKNGVAWFGVPGAKFMGLAGISLQPDGKTLVTGLSFKSETLAPRFFIARLTTTGQLDRSFGKGGVTRFTSWSAGVFDPVQVHPREDGSTILAFLDSESEEYPDLNLVRLGVDGHIDRTYGVKGTKEIYLGSDEYYITVPDLAIVGDDAFLLINADPDTGKEPCRVLRTSISSNGGPVATFGKNGTAEFGLESKKAPPVCSGLTPTADGGVAVSGWSYADFPNPPTRGFVYKLQANGSLDPSFGVAGKLTGPTRDRYSKITAVADGGFLTIGARAHRNADPVFPKQRGSARPVSAQGAFTDIFQFGAVPGTSQMNAVQLDHRPNGNLALYSNEESSF